MQSRKKTNGMSGKERDMGRITIERDETAGRLRCMFTPAVPEPGEFVIASEPMEIDTIIIQDGAQDIFMARANG